MGKLLMGAEPTAKNTSPTRQIGIHRRAHGVLDSDKATTKLPHQRQQIRFAPSHKTCGRTGMTLDSHRNLWRNVASIPLLSLWRIIDARAARVSCHRVMASRSRWPRTENSLPQSSGWMKNSVRRRRSGRDILFPAGHHFR